MIKQTINEHYVKKINDLLFISFILIREIIENPAKINRNNDNELCNLIDWISILLDQIIHLFILKKVSKEFIEKALKDFENIFEFIQENISCIELLNSLSSKFKLITSKIFKFYSFDISNDLIIEHLKI